MYVIHEGEYFLLMWLASRGILTGLYSMVFCFLSGKAIVECRAVQGIEIPKVSVLQLKLHWDQRIV